MDTLQDILNRSNDPQSGEWSFESNGYQRNENKTILEFQEGERKIIKIEKNMSSRKSYSASIYDSFKFTSAALILLITVTACSKYNDDELWERVNALENRVTSIENQLELLNNNISSIKAITEALQKKLYITNISTSGIGYTLTFSDGSLITISDGKDGKNGKDGKDGKDGVDGKDAPIINVRYYNDRYYWVQTMNGVTNWLMDENGNLIPASGIDAITPMLKTDSDGYWIISYDKGHTYSKLLDESGKEVKASGKDGDSFFESVDITENELIIILKDGSEIVIPLGEQSPYKSVNLGLSVKWATFNLGAATPSESGGLYLWGDVANNGVVPYYSAPNIDKIYASDYDIVRASWGGSWRLPNKAEQKELVLNCTWKKTTLNGVVGMRVTGTNGNSIFLPPTGYGMPKNGPAGQTERVDVNNGYYWVGESYKDTYGRFGYVFYFNNTSYYYNGGWNADMAKMAIRPVR